ncbi:MAG: hypothetical protein HAW67_03220 [Endozoicomonadaceae bacterium]|nr:hypothetical protein [Endozoicomonadaceae bacterium]
MKTHLVIKRTLIMSVLFSCAVEAVPFINCPTLAPLPITAFQPAAMTPINNTESVFDNVMNVVIKQAVILAAQNLANATRNSNVSIVKAVIQASQTRLKDEMELSKNLEEVKLAYVGQLESDVSSNNNHLFPSEKNSNYEKGSATYSLVKNMCTIAKMHQQSSGNKQQLKIAQEKAKKGRKITRALQSISSVQAASQSKVAAHYDIFCSENDMENGVCNATSAMPEADLSAYNFFYPIGSKSTNVGVTKEYQTLYTYNPVESFAAFQYIQNVTGQLDVAPPTFDESNQLYKKTFIGRYKQLMSVMSLSSDVLLEMSANREPANKSGVEMSPLDALRYQMAITTDPDNVILSNASSSAGKQIDYLQLLAINNKMQMLLFRQSDASRRLKAASIALDDSLNQR